MLLRTFLRRSAKTLVYALATLGFFDLVGRTLMIPLTGSFFGHALVLPYDYEIQQVVFSDDHFYKAIIYVWSGPGFGAGCNKMVAIVKDKSVVQTAWTTDNLVFQADCDEFFHIAWKPPAEGRVTPRLRIDADAGKGDFMSRLAINGRVAVAYRGDP